MPIYRIHDKRVLFIHIPKTGGTSVEKYLRGFAPEGMHNRGSKIVRPASGAMFSSSIPLQHFHGELLQATFPEGFFDYAFLIVRDPVARAVSAYRHSRALGRIEGKLSFSQWLKLMLPISKRLPYLRNNHLRPQVDFSCFGAEIFRFEDGVPAILQNLAERLDLEPPGAIPHERRIGVDMPEVRPEDISLIRAHYEPDYAAFGY